MGLDFCAIDFETANHRRGSPCAVGLARVVGGRVVETTAWLMRPPVGADEFDPMNIHIHGITPSMVRGEPRFSERLDHILAFAAGLPLVAHSAMFDIGVLRDACDLSGTAWPSLAYACTRVLGRATWPDLLSYSLPWVADAAGVPVDGHHHPGADAEATARILLAAAAHHGVLDLMPLLDRAGVRLGMVAPGSWAGCVRSNVPLPDPSREADPTHPLYGREIAFTGALSAMTREVAWRHVAAVGAVPAKGVTRRTDILVMGWQDAAVLAPGRSLSFKAQKAEDLRAAGRPIEIMDEVEFLRTIAP